MSVAKSVLVIEDDADICDCIVEALSLESFVAIGASTIAEAEELLASGQRFDVILTDWYLRGETAANFCENFLAKKLPQSHLPLILITARNIDDPAMPKVPRLAKPFSVSNLLSVINDAITPNLPQE